VDKIVRDMMTDLQRLEVVCRELYVQMQFSKEVAKMYISLLEEKCMDYTVATMGVRLHNQMKVFVCDLMVYLSQEDLVITEAREMKLAQMLTCMFSAVIKNKGVPNT